MFSWRLELKEAWMEVWGCFLENIRERGWLVLGVYLGFVMVTFPLIWPHDREWLNVVRADGGGKYAELEDFLAVAGDFFWFNVVWTVAFLSWGVWRKKKKWLRIGLIFFIGGALSGVTARVTKMTTGRARPSMTDKSDYTYRSFIGPNPKSKLHGYPSGHAAATMGSASAVWMACPKCGVPAVFFAGAVTYFRMYGNHHFPMDSIHGAALGLASGYLVARRKKRT